MLVAVAAMCAACAGDDRASDASSTAPTANARVVEVVDGDTIVVAIDGREESVRLIGIDTPETKHPRKPIECYGPEASEFASVLL